MRLGAAAQEPYTMNVRCKGRSASVWQLECLWIAVTLSLLLKLTSAAPSTEKLLHSVATRVAAVNVKAKLERLKEGFASDGGDSAVMAERERLGWLRVPLNHFTEEPEWTRHTPRTMVSQIPLDLLKVEQGSKRDEIGSLWIRYFVNERYAISTRKPRVAFLSMGGEFTRKNAGAWPIVYALAAKYKAMIVGIEHRFFGESTPSTDTEGPLATRLLKYLDPEQAIADAAHLIALFNAHAEEDDGTEHIVWITLGCSYSGSLAAWTQARYPNLVSGAIAASAPTRATMEFSSLEQHVQQAFRKEWGEFAPGGNRRAGGRCGPALHASLLGYEQELRISSQRSTELKRRWNLADPEGYNDLDFLYLLADLPAMSVQNGNRHKLCNCMEAQVLLLSDYNIYTETD